jgi:hypothetical protein
MCKSSVSYPETENFKGNDAVYYEVGEVCTLRTTAILSGLKSCLDFQPES